MNFNIHNNDDIFKDIIYIKKKKKRKEKKSIMFMFLFFLQISTKYAAYTSSIEEFNSDAFLQAIYKVDTNSTSSGISRTKVKYFIKL